MTRTPSCSSETKRWSFGQCGSSCSTTENGRAPKLLGKRVEDQRELQRLLHEAARLAVHPRDRSRLILPVAVERPHRQLPQPLLPGKRQELLGVLLREYFRSHVV